MACACFLRFDPAPLKRSRHEDAGGSLLIDGQVVLRLFCPGDESFLTSFHELWTSVNLMPSRIIFFMRFLNLIQRSELETAGGPKNFPPPSLRCETWMKRSLAIKIEGQLSETSPQYSLASLSLFFSAKLECNGAVLMETLPRCCTSSKLAWWTYSGSDCSHCCCCCCCSNTAGLLSHCSASVRVSDEKEPHQSGKSTPAASRCRLSDTVSSAALL